MGEEAGGDDDEEARMMDCFGAHAPCFSLLSICAAHDYTILPLQPGAWGQSGGEGEGEAVEEEEEEEEVDFVSSPHIYELSSCLQPIWTGMAFKLARSRWFTVAFDAFVLWNE